MQGSVANARECSVMGRDSDCIGKLVLYKSCVGVDVTRGRGGVVSSIVCDGPAG